MIKMKNYKYFYREGRKPKKLVSTISAINKAEALRELKYRGVNVLSISEETFIDKAKYLLKGRNGGKINKRTMSMLFKQLAFMRSSGLQLHRSVETLKNSTSDKNLKMSLERMSREIGEGTTFSGALDNQKDVYSSAVVHQIRSGERSGNIGDTMNQVSYMLDKEVKFTKSIQAAITYPIMVIIITVVIVFFLMAKVVPAMSEAIFSMGSELPFVTLLVIKFSDFMVNYGWIIGLSLVAGIIVFAHIYTTSKIFEYNVDRGILKIPYVGSLLLRLKIARFCRLMGSLQGSGVQIVQSLGIVKSAMGNIYLERKFEEVTAHIEQRGLSLPSALEEVKIFPDLLIQLTVVGSDSGKLQEVLELMADYFEEEVDESLNKVLKYIDIVLIVLVGIVVGVVVLSMFLPMFNFIGEF